MEKGNVLYAKKGEYRFQEVFFNGHPANKQNPNPPPPPKPKKTDPPPEKPPEKPPLAGTRIACLPAPRL